VRHQLLVIKTTLCCASTQFHLRAGEEGERTDTNNNKNVSRPKDASWKCGVAQGQLLSGADASFIKFGC